MVGEYLIKCIKTGEHIGDFVTIIHGSGECSNCGRHIKWLYVFGNHTRPAINIVLGSECAKNVPKFSEAYAKFKLFRDKIKLYLQWQGKKLSELPVDHRITLEDLDHEIAEHQRKEQEERAKAKAQFVSKIESQHKTLGTEFFERLERLSGKNSFLQSILTQSRDRLLSEKQIETAKRVMAQVEPAIQKQEQNEDKYRKQIERVKRFVWISDPDWAGGHGWTHEHVRTGRVHRELLLSFCQQLKQGKLLSDKQENVIVKCETIYKKHLRLNEIVDRLKIVEKITGVAWEGVKDEFYALKNEFKELSGKEYGVLILGVSPSDSKKASEGVKP